MVIVILSCLLFQASHNELIGNLIGNTYTINFYDDNGNKNMSIMGDKISIEGTKILVPNYSNGGDLIYTYEFSPVITINIDGKQIQNSGDACVFIQDGLNPTLEFNKNYIIKGSKNSDFESTLLSNIVTQYKNLFEKERIVVIKSQLGNPIIAFSCTEVSWEVPKNLPKMIKLMIDGKALYIYKCNFQIIDKTCFN